MKRRHVRSLWPRHARNPVITLVLLTAACSKDSSAVQTSDGQPIPEARCNASHTRTSSGSFALRGLSSPAVLAESVFVDASEAGLAASVTFFLDGKPLRTETQPPFWLGGDRSGSPLGYSLHSVRSGNHQVYAEARTASGDTRRSDTITLRVVSSLNDLLSPDLSTYANQITAQTQSVTTMLQRSSTPGATISRGEIEVRCAVLSMYGNWGIDPTLDDETDNSILLKALTPKRWSTQRLDDAAPAVSLRLSKDAPFYQKIPRGWPRVLLPKSYMRHVQLSTAYGGDGIGYGEVTAQANDPSLLVVSQWFDRPQSRKSFDFAIPKDWVNYLPTQTKGDRHMLFIDLTSQRFFSTYQTSPDRSTGAPRALYASSPTSFSTLGDAGGSNASNIAELPLLIQPGEITDTIQPLRHAIGGAVSRTWAARVYPATAWDANVRNSENTCTHQGFTNTGLVPYGGVIQLDPELDLSSLPLSLPALRILQAMQTYGYYVLDFGCADLDIYTALSATELEVYGGLWGSNGAGRGVQTEVEDIVTTHKLFVVAPLLKKQ